MSIPLPWLQDSISDLPGPLKAVALAAASGSSEDLVQLCLVLPTLPKEQAVKISSIFFNFVDPSLIPDPRTLDGLGADSNSGRHIDDAVRSLRALCTLSRNTELVPGVAAPALWRRVWPWISFLHVYWTALPRCTTAQAEQPVMLATYCALIMMLRDNDEVRKEMAKTSGVSYLIAKSWRQIVDHNVAQIPQSRAAELSLPLIALIDWMKHDAVFEEVVAAFDGSHIELALALKMYISKAANYYSKEPGAIVSSVIVFILPTFIPYPQFTDVLVSHGIVPSLMAFLETALQAPSASDWSYDIVHCVGAISMYTSATPGYPWVVQALQAGILRHIIVLGERILTPADKGIYLALKRLLCETFPGALLSYRVLKQMKQSIAEVEAASKSLAFSQSALNGEWTALTRLLKDRLELLGKWEAEGRPSFLVCDNMKCAKIGMKKQFRCCSGCQLASYCSAECQRRDWVDTHRDACDAFRFTRHHNLDTQFCTHERAFMRAVLQADYEYYRFAIASSILKFMAATPGVPFFVLFDYTGPNGLRLSVSAKDLLFVNRYSTAQWRRFADAGGRMMFHVVRVWGGGAHSNVITPLRASSPKFYEGLQRIAKKVPALAPSQVDALLEALIQTTEREVVEIH
ncbi:hypothetical protein C8R47DRAFT_1136226 [Mycena vitilis]|nr:hypothetical protein C8R47DRAFT_1136226 [Mycena vitilis]